MLARPDGTLRRAPAFLVAGGVLALVYLASRPLVTSGDPTTLVFVLSYSVVGLLLVTRRPRTIVGWLLIAIAAGFVGTSPPPDVDVPALLARVASPRDAFLVWIATWAGGGVWFLFTVLALVFPSGRLPAGRARKVARAVLAAAALAVIVSMVAPTTTVYTGGQPDGVDVPNPFGLLPANDLTTVGYGVSLGVLLGCLGVAIAMLLLRYRREEGIGRLQLRWVLASITFALVTVVVGIGLTLVAGQSIGALAWIPAIVAYPTLPVAIGVAIFRYRLYEIDRIVNRALVYGSVTAILTGVLAAASAVSQKYLAELAGGSNEFAIVAITLVVATLYAPVRKRVESVVDRYFKYEQRQFGPYRDELRRVADLVDPQRAAVRLAGEALAETRASGVGIMGPDGLMVTSAGTWPVDVVARVDLTGSPRSLGSILLGPRVDARPYPATTLAALGDVASLVELIARAGVRSDPPRVSIAVGDPEPEEHLDGPVREARDTPRSRTPAAAPSDPG